MPTASQIFFLLFIMLGPFKILGPLAKITRGATPGLIRTICFRAILYATIILLLAAVLGDKMLANFGISLPILTLAGGVILFLVALLNVLKQFETPDFSPAPEAAPPPLRVAMNPLAFPIIVTPYGIAAVIVFMGLSPDMKGKLMVVYMVLAIMAINLIFMLVNRYIFKVLAVILPLLGAILGLVQVALGLKIIYTALKALLVTQQ
jgi:multiple antibiotic resistance protein